MRMASNSMTNPRMVNEAVMAIIIACGPHIPKAFSIVFFPFLFPQRQAIAASLRRFGDFFRFETNCPRFPVAPVHGDQGKIGKRTVPVLGRRLRCLRSAPSTDGRTGNDDPRCPLDKARPGCRQGMARAGRTPAIRCVAVSATKTARGRLLVGRPWHNGPGRNRPRPRDCRRHPRRNSRSSRWR